MDIKVTNSNNSMSYAKTEKTDGSEKEKALNNNSDNKTSGSIDASDLNLAGSQNNTLKELLAKRAAIKVQMDQFEKDRNLDDAIKKHENNREDYLKEANVNQTEVNRLTDLKKSLKETYGVEDGSTEQNDLELLEKQADLDETLTDEELNRIANMGPLTDYQKGALEYDAMAAIWQYRADDSLNQSQNENRAIEAVKMGRLKTHPMLDAKNEAKDILKQVDEEIQAALLDELKKKVNENLDIDPNENILTDPKSLVEKKKVTDEDLKGLAVDEKA